MRDTQMRPEPAPKRKRDRRTGQTVEVLDHDGELGDVLVRWPDGECGWISPARLRPIREWKPDTCCPECTEYIAEVVAQEPTP